MPRIVWQHVNMVWLLVALLVGNCAQPVTDERLRKLTSPSCSEPEKYKELLSQKLWVSDAVEPDSIKSIEPGLLQAVSLESALEATNKLKDVSWIPVSERTARALIGKDYVPPGLACKAAISGKEARIQQLQGMMSSFPDSRQQYDEWINEQKVEINQIRNQRGTLRPYLCRAVAFQGCGTGGFGGVFDGPLLSISYAALGGGGFAKYNHPVVVFLPNPPTRLGIANSVAR